MDRFRKNCIMMPCKKKITNEKTANLFFQNVWVRFGFPTSIVSDQDSPFVGNFWSSLWGFMDIKLKKSTTFHPQTYGKTEVVTTSVIRLLCGYCENYPKLLDGILYSFSIQCP